jgi:hypothetical protein
MELLSLLQGDGNCDDEILKVGDWGTCVPKVAEIGLGYSGEYIELL